MFVWTMLPDLHSYYHSDLHYQIVTYGIPIIFIITLYATFRNEIAAYWEQLYNNSITSIKNPNGYDSKIFNYDLIKFSAGGLRDFSRIAASNEIMWRDIFFNNKQNISRAIDLFIKNLNSFKKDINSKNNKSILKKLIQTKKVRSKIIKLKQDINKPDFGRN